MRAAKKTIPDQTTHPAVLIIHNVRSAHNVGSMFRTADGAGITKIFCTGYTPTPVDRFGKAQGDIRKTALGAEQAIPWESKKSIASLLRSLKREGYRIIAIEQDVRSVPYTNVRPGGKVAFVVGNEVGGLTQTVLKEADSIAEIPMRGKKESLNVSVALGVALFRILDQQ